MMDVRGARHRGRPKDDEGWTDLSRDIGTSKDQRIVKGHRRERFDGGGVRASLRRRDILTMMITIISVYISCLPFSSQRSRTFLRFN